MSVDPDLRIALGLLVLLRISVGVILKEPRAERDKSSSGRNRWHPLRDNGSWLVVPVLLIAPIVAFLIDVHGLGAVIRAIHFHSGRATQIEMLDLLRWLAATGSLIGLLMFIWVRAVALKHASESNADRDGKHVSDLPRLIRYPEWLADLLFFGALLVATANWLSIALFVIAVAILQFRTLPACDAQRELGYGPEYATYRDATGFLLPRLRQYSRNGPGYVVPKRFGINAMLALVTLFAVIFGLLNAFQSRITDVEFGPMLHLYFGLLLTFVWIAQMRFGESARLASVVVGAVLLPIFVFVNAQAAGARSRPMAFVVLGAWGGLLGYCMGAIAAGFFLVLDWMGPYLPWSRKPSK